MKEKKHAGTRWISGTVLVLLVLFFIINIGLAKQPVVQLAKGELSFSEFKTEIQEAYTSDEFSLKRLFININGLFARLTGQRVCNDVVLMDNGMLTEVMKKKDMSKQAKAVEELSEYLKQEKIPFLYVQAPYKEDPEDELFPEGVSSYANENADELLAYVEEMQVETLNLAPYFNATEELIETYYYRTDHHWNNTGAFVAFQKICERISEMFPEKAVDVTYADFDQWEKHTLENWFLGSRGKRVGAWFTGTDDYTWYTPLFETKMSCAIPKHRQMFYGDFTAANIREKYIKEKDYFENSAYVAYIGGDYPVVQHRNHEEVTDLKVLIIKDSYVLPVQAYLSTVFTEVDVVDPRHLTECTVAEYIARTEPDLVMLLFNPSCFGTEHYLDFGVKEALAQGERAEQPLWEKNIVVEPSETNNYHYKALNMEYAKTYTVTFEDVEFLKGQADGVVVALYNRTTKTILSSGVFDSEYCRKAKEFQWTFSTPESGSGELVLIFYAGMPGATKNISVEYKNVTLYEWE